MGDPLFLSPQLKMFFPPGAQTHEGSEHMFWPDGQDSNRSIPFGWGTLPLRSSFLPFSSEQRALDFWIGRSARHVDPLAESDRILRLGGVWDFLFFDEIPQSDPVSLFSNPSFSHRWGLLKVPSNWQLEGSGKPIYTNIKYPFPCDPPHIPWAQGNETGFFRRTVQLPEGWTEGDVHLRFEGVDSAFRLWVNGEEIGCYANTYGPSEFDITRFFRKGTEARSEVELWIMVHRWTPLSYLEDQDCWRLSGIFREPYLIHKPRAGLRDFKIRAKMGGAFESLVEVDSKVASVRAAIWDLSGRCLHFKTIETVETEQSQGGVEEAAHGSQMLRLNFNDSSLLNWSPENPHLYLWTITCFDSTGSETESVGKRFGFRTSEIKDSCYLLNKEPIRIKGVNRHEFHPQLGRALGIAEIAHDLILLKQHHFNALRTSHYPNHPWTYELCDELGILVMDEANIETHELWQWNGVQLAEDAKYTSAFLHRVQSLYERDKNATCVGMWSLGNEAGYGKSLKLAEEWLRNADTRPIHYEGRFPYEMRSLPPCDFISNMYPSVDDIVHLHQADPSRPVVICEYSHSMGNSTGNFWKYWDLFDDVANYRNVQGGYLWDFVDQGIARPGHSDLAYGGDFGDIPNDGNFCFNGIFFSDRSPTPSAREVRKVLEPVDIELISAAMTGKTQPVCRVKLRNKNFFQNLKDHRFEWSCENNIGQTMAQGQFPISDLPPQSSREVEISFTQSSFVSLKQETEIWLNVSLKNPQGSLWSAPGFVVGSAQFQIPEQALSINALQHKELPKELDQRNTGDGLSAAQALFETDSLTQLPRVVRTTNSTWAFGDNGDIRAAWFGSVPVLCSDILPCLWRAPIDNDGGWGAKFDGQPANPGQKEMYTVEWQRFELEHLKPVVESIRFVQHKDSWVFRRKGFFSGSSGGLLFPWEMAITLSEQSFQVDFSLQNTLSENVQTLPRVGISFQVPSQFSLLRWFGRGPYQSYPDKKSSEQFGLYNCRVHDNHVNYPKPQENGLHSDTHWMALHSSFGNTLKVTSFQQDFFFNAQNYSPWDLGRASHPSQIKKRDEVFVNLDLSHLGVGGDDSWSPKTHSEFLVNKTSYSGTFLIQFFNSLSIAMSTG